jgi:integrase/recombinase XerD
MIDKLFVKKHTIRHHHEAPLLSEREEFLTHLLQLGTTQKYLRKTAATLVHIIDLMKLTSMREVRDDEIVEASVLWPICYGAQRRFKDGEANAVRFKSVARNWFRYHKVLLPDPVNFGKHDKELAEFVEFQVSVRGMQLRTAKAYRSNVCAFLIWLMPHREVLAMITLANVDDFVEHIQTAGYRTKSILSFCAALRAFFTYADLRGWNTMKISKGIESPKIMRESAAPKGPKWTEVRRLLRFSASGTKPADLRAAAILSLCSIYGLRGSEVLGLLLSDFDWVNETLTIRRAKNGRVQQFPIQFEVGETILRYVQYGRPRCHCRNLFVTLLVPYRRLDSSSTVWSIAVPRMKSLKMSPEHFGGHSLRHSCATELLRKGAGLRDIADFLGHRTLRSVSAYAKHDMRALGQVATLSLAGLR